MSRPPPPGQESADHASAESAAPDGAWAVAHVQRDGMIASANIAAAALAGLTPAKVEGHHYTEFLAPRARDRVAAAVDAALAGAPATTVVAEQLARGGATTTVAWTIIPTRDADGTVTGVLGTGMPLPDVVLSEPGHARERFWRDVFDANPMAIAVIDVDDRVLGLNACFTDLFGYAEREARGRTLHTLIGAPSDAAQHAVRLLDAGLPLALNGERRAKDGRRIAVHSEAAAFEAEDGRPGLVVTYRRLADQRQLEAQVIRAQHLEGVALFASSVLHDVNNLLMAVVGQADLLADAPPDVPFDAERREDLRVLRAAARRAATLARTVGSFARPRDARPEHVDVAALIDRLRPVLSGVVGRRITVQYDVDPDAGSVHAVPAELEQVVLNLVTNARDAMPEGGTLRVGLHAHTLDAERAAARCLGPGAFVALDVADTGRGMPPEVARRAFEPFFTTKGEAGTGLGLAIIQRIVRRTGGDVAVESTLGVGTTFHLLLPADAPAATPANTPAAVGAT